MKVPQLDLNAQYQTIKEELEAAILGVVRRHAYILGPAVEKFEGEIARYIGARHAIGVSSGSDALLLSLMALNVGEGDEVITTPFTFFATASCVARLKARPVFADIRPDTYNIDVEAIRKAITKRTRAIIPVDLYGQVADMEEIAALGEKHGIPVIEDACQAIGAKRHGKMAGTFGRVGCFSFYPSKNLGACGEGGLITTDDDDLARRFRALRQHGMTAAYHHEYLGINARMHGIQGAVLSVKLKYLDKWAKGRQAVAAKYARLFAEAGLSEFIAPPAVLEGNEHIYHQYVVRAQRRDGLLEHMHKASAGGTIYYPAPLHLQPCFKGLGYKKGDFPVTEQACREALALPIYAELTDEQQRYVVDTLKDFYTKSTGQNCG
jgi:dTDP-4-amino-4,6-dideoxygalactose transaminase